MQVTTEDVNNTNRTRSKIALFKIGIYISFKAPRKLCFFLSQMLETLETPDGGGGDAEEGRKKEHVGGYGGIQDLSAWTK